MRDYTSRNSSVFLILAVLMAAAATAADWPQYRGPSQDGHSTETGLYDAWPSAGPKELWRYPLGDGYSGIAIAGDRAFTMFGSGTDELAVALDTATGAELWRVRIGANRRDSYGDGPRSTPTVYRDVVYTLGANGKLSALAVADGTVVWARDLVSDFGARVPRWGVSTSTLVEGDLVLIDAGGRPGYSLVALDRRTGALRWHAETDRPGYSTPLAVTVGGVRQILFFTGSSLVSVAPEDGKVFWRYPWKTSYDVNAAMPVFVPPDRVFVSSSYDKGAAVLQMIPNDGEVRLDELWRNRVMKNHFNSSVLVDRHLYGFDDKILTCIDAETGEEVWAKRGFNKGSLIYADGRLIVLGERGELAMIEATPDGYRELASHRIFDVKTWTMPSLAGGRLFVRSQGELVAVAVGPTD